MDISSILLGVKLTRLFFVINKAIKNNAETPKVIKVLTVLYVTHKQALDLQKEKTGQVLDELARTKVKVSANEIKTFLTAYKKFRNWTNEEGKYTGIRDGKFEHDHFISPSYMKLEAITATDILKNGLNLTQEEIAVIAAQGGIGAMRTANASGRSVSRHGSTSTSFGASGFSFSMLKDGIPTATAIAMGKLISEAKIREKLDNTPVDLQLLMESIEKVENFCNNLVNLCQIANDYEIVILNLSRELNVVISCMNSIFNRYSGSSANSISDRYSTHIVSQVDFSNLDREERESLNNALNVAQTLQQLLNQRLVNDHCQVDTAAKELLHKVRSDYGI